MGDRLTYVNLPKRLVTRVTRVTRVSMPFCVDRNKAVRADRLDDLSIRHEMLR